MTKIDVEEAMARVVQAAGGQLVSDLLPKDQNLAENADYFFPQYGVIAELKQIKKDLYEDKEFRDKRNALYHKWMVRGMVPPIDGTILVETRNLPEYCALEFVSLYREPIRRRISKANKQIKSTRRLLNIDNVIGLFILVQDGDYSIGPEAVINLTSRCMNGGLYSNIDNVLYLSGNMLASRPGDGVGYQLFISCFRNQNTCLPDKLLSRLNSEWYQELNAQSETRIMTVNQPISEYLDGFRYRKPRIQPG